MGLLTVKKQKQKKPAKPKHDSPLIYGGRSPQEFLNTEIRLSVRIFGYAGMNTLLTYTTHYSEELVLSPIT